MSANAPQELDRPERADLLCFLVLVQLVGHATTSGWQRNDHFVAATRMWLASSSAVCDWIERVKLARMSADIAPQFLVFPCFRNAKEIVKMFADGWRLDYRSPIVRGMVNIHAAKLLT